MNFNGLQEVNNCFDGIDFLCLLTISGHPPSRSSYKPVYPLSYTYGRNLNRTLIYSFNFYRKQCMTEWRFLYGNSLIWNEGKQTLLKAIDLMQTDWSKQLTLRWEKLRLIYKIDFLFAYSDQFIGSGGGWMASAVVWLIVSRSLWLNKFNWIWLISIWFCGFLPNLSWKMCCRFRKFYWFSLTHHISRDFLQLATGFEAFQVSQFKRNNVHFKLDFIY